MFNRESDTKIMEEKFTIDRYSGSHLESDDIRLSLSENECGFSKKVKKRLEKEIEIINMYPDADYSELISKIAKKNKIIPSQVYIANGSDEIIFTVVAGLRKKLNRIISFEKSFAGYRNSADFIGVAFKELPISDSVEQFFEIGMCKGDMIIFPNPHNPLGIRMNDEFINQLAQYTKEKEAFLVVDEAYIEFCGNSCIDILSKYNNMFIIRTFSKAYGLAGLRCGYVMSSVENIDNLYLLRKSLPYNVNRMAYAAACEAIEDEEFLKYTIEKTVKNREWFEKELKSLGIEFYKSYTNFVTIVIEDSRLFVDRIYEEKKILLKDLEGLGYKNHIRIAIGKRQHLEEILFFIKQYVGEKCSLSIQLE